MQCRDIGPLDASIMLIGEAPGREEEKDGIPFVGQAGKLLKSMCSASGIDFNRCYVTNISPERPPGNDFGYFYEDPKRNIPKESLRKRWFDLGDKIKRINPKVVMCLGDEPLRAVTNLRGVGSWRGTRLEAYGTKVIATYHPANILREYSNRVIAEMDLRKALRESEGLIYQKPEILISPSITQALSWLSEAKRSKTRVGFDIETIGTTIRSIAFGREMEDGSLCGISIPFLRMLQSSSVSFSHEGHGIIKPGNGLDVNYWSKSDEILILNAIADVLESDEIEKVGQNSIHFDAPLIEQEFGIKIRNHKMDTMHAWHLLYPSLLKGLDFISSIITDHPNYWTLHDSHIDSSEWVYNAMDAIVVLEISRKIENELREEGLYDFYYNLTHPLVFALLEAQKRGVEFDVDEAKGMKLELEEELRDVKTQLRSIVGAELNPLSPKQVKELIYDKLKFPTVYDKKTKKATTSEDALLRLHSKYPSEESLNLIIQYRKTSKLISTYIDVSLDPDGRVRCSYDASGTITGRISSSKTIFGTGMDLHNIPKGDTRGSRSTRHLYRASKRHVFVKGDLKQAEAMVVAWILKGLGDSTLYDLYHTEGFDIHRWCASNFVYLIPENEISKIQRNQGGKLANHSGNYMAGPGVMEKRARQMGWEGFSYRFCKEILERRKNGIPGLSRWWEEVEKKLQATRTLETCFGRRLQFFGRIEGDELRSAVAFEPQSTVGDVCNKMFIELSRSEKWFPVLTTHDEIVLETLEEDGDEAARAMVDASRISLRIRPNVEELIIPIEIGLGVNWKDTKEWKGALR